MSGRGLPEYVNAYLREQMRAWLAAEPGRKQTHLAKELEFTDAQVSAVLNEKRGAGWDMVDAVAKKLLGITRDELEERARAAWNVREPKPSIHIEYDDRYPNRRRALAGLDVAGVKLHPRARRAIETRVYHSTTDPPPEHWIREAMQLDERARWEDANPEQAARDVTGCVRGLFGGDVLSRAWTSTTGTARRSRSAAPRGSRMTTWCPGCTSPSAIRASRGSGS